MPLSDIRIADFIPIIGMAIPIVAIIGGITAGIMRTMGRQRLVELAQRERIAAIERGLDPAKLPPLPDMLDDESREVWRRSPKHRAQGLMIGGLATLFGGVALAVFLLIMEEGETWAVGILPASVGLALLVSAVLVWPRDEQR